MMTQKGTEALSLLAGSFGLKQITVEEECVSFSDNQQQSAYPL